MKIYRAILMMGVAVSVIGSNFIGGNAYADNDTHDNNSIRGFIIRTNTDSNDGGGDPEGFFVIDGQSATTTIDSRETGTTIRSSLGHSMSATNAGGVVLNGGSVGTSITGSGGLTVSGGAANVNVNNNHNTNINSGTSTGDVTIGNSTNGSVTNLNSHTTNMTGIANINTSGSAATSIGTGTYSGTVAIGNSLSTTTIHSAINNIGTNAGYASANTIGNSHAGTTASIVGGNSGFAAQNGSASISSGSNGFSTYSANRTVGTNYTLVNGNTASQNLVNGSSVTNIIRGNTLVDGNMYINGTLVYSSNTSASTTVTDSGSGTSGALNVTNAGQHGYVSDGNGKITSETAGETTASLTVTNEKGNSHGIVVGQSATTISGGTNSSSMILNDNGARFSSATTGGPIRVTGVADGKSDFDAVNYRQLKSIAAGVAGISAMSNIPQVDQDKTFNVGLGVGHFQERTAVALGASARLSDSVVARASVATDFGADSTAVGGGLGWSW